MLQTTRDKKNLRAADKQETKDSVSNAKEPKGPPVIVIGIANVKPQHRLLDYTAESGYTTKLTERDETKKESIISFGGYGS